MPFGEKAFRPVSAAADTEQTFHLLRIRAILLSLRSLARSSRTAGGRSGNQLSRRSALRVGPGSRSLGPG